MIDFQKQLYHEHFLPFISSCLASFLLRPVHGFHIFPYLFATHSVSVFFPAGTVLDVTGPGGPCHTTRLFLYSDFSFVEFGVSMGL